MSPRLHSIGISDFRSIRGSVTIELDAPVVLIHGPNGSGKTSILSAIELALTGAIPSLARVEPDYAAHLVHKQAHQGQVKLKVDGLSGASQVTLPITSTGPRGKHLLSQRLAKFYSERCYLPQSVLGRLLELYQTSDARKSDSPLTEFVKDILGLDQLDALIDGLHDAGDIRRLRKPVPLYAEVRDDIRVTAGTIRVQDAELEQLRSEVASAEAKLTEGAALIDPDVATAPLNLELLRSRLDRSNEGVRLNGLARIRRDVAAAASEWRNLAVPMAADRRQEVERRAASAQADVENWRASGGQQLESLIEQLAGYFPDLPSLAGTEPEFARATALRSVQKEHARCAAVLAQDAIDVKHLEELDQELSRLHARSTVLDQEIGKVGEDAGALAQALAGIAPHIHTNDCPVCGRDFKEISKRALSAHVSSRIAALTESAARLQALSGEKASIITSIAQTARDRSRVASRQISDATRNELKQRRAKLEEIGIKLERLAESTQRGLVLLQVASQAARALDALRSRDLQITNFRESLARLGADLGLDGLNINDPIETLLTQFQSVLDEEESRLASLQERKQRASADLAIVVSLRARLVQLGNEVAGYRHRLAQFSEAKANADERIAAAKELGRKAREVRTSVVRRVFNDSLNHIWNDLFVRLAPEEPFVPAFALPSNTEGPVEAILETRAKTH